MSGKIHKIKGYKKVFKKVPMGKDTCSGCYFEGIEKDCFRIWNTIGCDKHVFKEVPMSEYLEQEDKKQCMRV